MLTPEEEAELALLEDEEAQESQQTPVIGLTPEEQAELEALDGEEKNYQEEKEMGYMDKGLKMLIQAGKFVDSLGGAPARAMIGEAQKGIGLPNPTEESDAALEAQGFTIKQNEDPNQQRTAGQAIGDIFAKGVSQFGSDPSTAPTGKEIVQKAGVNGELQPAQMMANEVLKRATGGILGNITTSDVAGLAMDVAADPFLLIPGKALMKGAKAAPKAVLRTSAKAADILAGTDKFTDVVNATEEATKGVIKSMKARFAISKAVDAQDYLKLADQLGIDRKILPEAVEYGTDSLLARQGRVIAEGPLGAQRLENYGEVISKINNAVDKTIDSFSPVKIAGKADAGNYLVKSLDDATKSFFDSMDLTYNKILENSPGMTMTKSSQANIESALNGIEKFAKGRVSRGIGSQRSEAAELLKAVEAIRNSNGTLKQTLEALRNIGEEAYKSSNSMAAANRMPIDVKRLRKLYTDVRKEVLSTVRSRYGQKTADGLAANNKMIEEFLGEQSVIGKIINRPNAAPEDIFKSLIENGNTKEIDALASMLPKENMNALKSELLRSIVKKNADGIILADSTIKELNKRTDVLVKLFNPEEMKQIDNLLRFQKRLGRPVMSTSGTGASNAFNNLMNEAKGVVANEATIETLKKQANKVPGTKGFDQRLGEGLRGIVKPTAKASRLMSIERDKKK
jgi:hypothetical protein